MDRCVYPFKQGQKIPGSKAKFDELAYYAEHFNTVEINHTFYRPPAVKTAQSWAARTPPGFEFSLKLFRQFTRKREVTVDDVDAFKRGIDSLANAEKLGALLCQFRNAKKWWHHEHKDERYDYLYSAPEIQEFGETLQAVRKIVRTSYGYMNNHPDAKSVVNAIQLKHVLKEPIAGDYNPELIKRYPELKAIVRAPAKREVLVPVRRS